MVKFSELDAKTIDKIFYDKLDEAINCGYPRDVARRIANNYIFKLWEKEKYPDESNR